MFSQNLNFRQISYAFLLITLIIGFVPGCKNSVGHIAQTNDKLAAGSVTETGVPAKGVIEGNEVEQAIAAKLPQKIGVPIKSVSCPNKEVLQPGKVFECKAQIAQGSFPIRITVKDAQGNLNFKTKQILLLPEAETQLQQSVKAHEKVDVKAECGDKIKLFQKVGEQFSCKLVKPDGKTGTATIKVISEEGKVDAKWKL
jgi:hypothetical protein